MKWILYPFLLFTVMSLFFLWGLQRFFLSAEKFPTKDKSEYSFWEEKWNQVSYPLEQLKRNLF